MFSFCSLLLSQCVKKILFFPSFLLCLIQAISPPFWLLYFKEMPTEVVCSRRGLTHRLTLLKDYLINEIFILVNIFEKAIEKNLFIGLLRKKLLVNQKHFKNRFSHWPVPSIFEVFSWRNYVFPILRAIQNWKFVIFFFQGSREESQHIESTSVVEGFIVQYSQSAAWTLNFSKKTEVLAIPSCTERKL